MIERKIRCGIRGRRFTVIERFAVNKRSRRRKRNYKLKVKSKTPLERNLSTEFTETSKEKIELTGIGREYKR